MILIGENIHIISKSVKSALENRDEIFIRNLIEIQQDMDVIDLNVGPSKGKLENIFEWLCNFTGNKPISFDSSNIEAITEGLKLYNSEYYFINSTSADDDRLEKLSDLALKYGCNLIALSMTKEDGIPRSADERIELVFKIYEKCMDKGISSDKLYFDPLILPVKADQSQALEALNTIKTIKESFEPPVNTLIGLSNISNGMPANIRPVVNRVYGVLAYGAGLDAAIIDAKDKELLRIFIMLETNEPKNKTDELYINLANMIQCFGELEDIIFDKNDFDQSVIIKTAEVLLNKTIYSDSFAQI